MSNSISREDYYEYHESREELAAGQLEPVEKEAEGDVLEDCPYCKHDAYCKGGCKNGTPGYTSFRYERKGELN